MFIFASVRFLYRIEEPNQTTSHHIHTGREEVLVSTRYNTNKNIRRTSRSTVSLPQRATPSLASKSHLTCNTPSQQPEPTTQIIDREQAMPSKIQQDENLYFLLICLQNSDLKIIDFAAVAAHTNIKAPAARMRYTRLKRQIEANPPLAFGVKQERKNNISLEREGVERLNLKSGEDRTKRKREKDDDDHDEGFRNGIRNDASQFCAHNARRLRPEESIEYGLHPRTPYITSPMQESLATSVPLQNTYARIFPHYRTNRESLSIENLARNGGHGTASQSCSQGAIQMAYSPTSGGEDEAILGSKRIAMERESPSSEDDIPLAKIHKKRRDYLSPSSISTITAPIHPHPRFLHAYNQIPNGSTVDHHRQTHYQSTTHQPISIPCPEEGNDQSPLPHFIPQPYERLFRNPNPFASPYVPTQNTECLLQNRERG